jgi:hypothetical protein
VKKPTELMDALLRRMATLDYGRVTTHHWYDGARMISITSHQLAGLVERKLITPYRPSQGQRHELTTDGLKYAVERGWITVQRGAEIELTLRRQAEEDAVAHILERHATEPIVITELREVEPPAAVAPRAYGSTDELLHALREAVAEVQKCHPSILSGADFATFAAMFDELDYRMSRGAYPMPGAWAENRR